MKNLLLLGFAAAAPNLFGNICPLNLLGERDRLNTHYIRELRSDEPFYLNDHRVGGRVLFPGAGFVMNSLYATLADVISNPMVVLGNFKVRLPLELNPDETCQLHTSIELGEKRVKVRCETTGNRATELHSSADVQYTETLPKIAFAVVPPTERICVPTLYETLERSGLQYGPNFRLLQTVQVGQNEVRGTIAAPEILQGENGHLNPAILDAALQSVAAFALRDGQVRRLDKVGVPMMFGKIHWDRALPPDREYLFRIRVKNHDDLVNRRDEAGRIEYDLELSLSDGRALLVIEDGILVLLNPREI